MAAGTLASGRRRRPPSASALRRLLLPTVSVLATVTLATAAAPLCEPPSYGPFVHEFSLTLEPGERIEGAGPLLWAERLPEWERWGLSPFFTYAHHLALDTEEFDILYPFLTYDRFGDEYKLRFFLMTSFTGGHHQGGQPVRRFTLFPFLFFQRSPTPEFNYTAVFPLHGTLRDRLNRDEIRFTLFPLYSQTRKRGVLTRNYLYPFYHRRTGDHLTGWQLWPLASHESRTPFAQTNDFGDVNLVPGHDKSFILWPFWLQDDTGLGTTNPVTARALLPFYFSTRSPARDSTTFLWPFFSRINDRARRYREWQMPFPLINFARGPGKTTDRVFPFYSRARTATAESGFLLWPIYKVNRFHGPPLSRERERILFFLYSDLRETNTSRHTVLRRRDFWPLFTHRRDHEGGERLQVLAPLEPFLPNNKAVERAYSPLWSVWRSEQNPNTQTASTSFLWNLYRHDTAPGRRKTSLLFGLFQYQSAPGERRWRILYLPAVKSTARHDRTREPAAHEPPTP